MAKYDPTAGIEDQAADALLDAISLYKAAGWTRETMEAGIATFWAMQAEAKPFEKSGE